jgi:hypothetical protein
MRSAVSWMTTKMATMLTANVKMNRLLASLERRVKLSEVKTAGE